MKKLYCLVVLCMFMFEASAVAAQEDKGQGTPEGVDVKVVIDPLGPNNQISAYVAFVNKNDYKVNIKWTPVMSCGEGNIKRGYGEDFSMTAGASYDVTIWRLSACGFQTLNGLTVDMEVKRAD